MDSIQALYVFFELMKNGSQINESSFTFPVSQLEVAVGSEYCGPSDALMMPMFLIVCRRPDGRIQTKVLTQVRFSELQVCLFVWQICSIPLCAPKTTKIISHSIAFTTLMSCFLFLYWPANRWCEKGAESEWQRKMVVNRFFFLHCWLLRICYWFIATFRACPKLLTDNVVYPDTQHRTISDGIETEHCNTFLTDLLSRGFMFSSRPCPGSVLCSSNTFHSLLRATFME